MVHPLLDLEGTPDEVEMYEYCQRQGDFGLEETDEEKKCEPLQ